MSNINQLVLLSEERLSSMHSGMLKIPTSKEALNRFNGHKRLALNFRKNMLDWSKQQGEHMHQALRVHSKYGEDAANIYAKYAKTNILKD